MECEVHSQLYNYLEEGKLISDFQFGFRKGKSTEQAILTLLDNIKNSVDSGKLVGDCFIDLSKTFELFHIENFWKSSNVTVYKTKN